MITIDCPHVANPREECPGCFPLSGNPEYFGCHGEVSANILRDVEGDYGVIGGTHLVTTLEIESLSCGCNWTVEEQDDVYDQLFDASDPSDYDGLDYDAEDYLEDF